MERFSKLSFLVLVLGLTNSAFCNLEVINEWNGGWQAILHVNVPVETHGWTIVLDFNNPVETLEVFQGHITGNVESKIFSIENESWDGDLEAGTIFNLDIIVRYPENTAKPSLNSATFNDVPVDVGAPITGPTDAPTSPGTGPTTTTTTRKPDPPGEYDYGYVISLSNLFYEAQRSGKLPEDNRISWRGDSFLDDSDGGVDLTGGYFDAGDHVKFGFPFAAMSTLLAWGLLDYKEGYEAANEYENGLRTLKWSLDYFMKAHPSPNEFYGQMGDGNEDHAFWGRPEEWSTKRPAFKISTSAPGSDLAGETAACFAVASMIYKDSDPAFAAECLRHATELYDFADQYRGVYSDSITNAQSFYNSWSGYGDELGWSAAWLYRATENAKYLEDVERHWNEFGLNGKPQEFGWDDKKAGLQVLLAKITGDAVYVDAARAFCDFIVNDIPRSPLGLAFISQWGALRHVGNVAFVCLQAADAGINPEVYRDFAKQQIGYILGDTGRSFVVGYGTNPPQRPHHRSSSCPNLPEVCDWNAFNNPGPNPQTLFGALVGGPGIDDSYVDDRNDYIKNEVATDYNAGFQSALAGLNLLKAQGKL